MYQLPEPTRPTLDLLDEGVVIPGWTIVTWTATGPRLAWPPRHENE
jgi:hypothetical protein